MAGVSHSAAYRHFADREALLVEVSRHARSELAAEIRRRVNRAKDPLERLQAVGTAYVDFALTQPGLFRTAFISHPAAATRPDDHDRPAPETRSLADSAEPYEILGQVLDEAQAAGLLDPHRRPGAEIAAWSAVHGLASLLLEGPLPTSAADIEFSLGQVLDLIARGLLERRLVRASPKSRAGHDSPIQPSPIRVCRRNSPIKCVTLPRCNHSRLAQDLTLDHIGGL